MNFAAYTLPACDKVTSRQRLRYFIPQAVNTV